jgi:hypothetical protein
VFDSKEQVMAHIEEHAAPLAQDVAEALNIAERV